MNKIEFMHVLSTHLNKLPATEKADILYDYEEHFTIGLEQGKPEEEIVNSLGDPRIIAKQFSADSFVKQASETKSVGNITRAVFATAGLGFFNLVFVFGPFMGLLAVLISLFAVAFAFAICGIVFVLAVIAAPLFPHFIDLGGLNPGAAIFAGIGLSCFGILCFMGVVILAKWFFKGTLNYLKMNIRIIKK